MKARALLIEALVGIASAAVAAGAFCWMATPIPVPGVNETGTPLQGVTKRNPLTGSPKTGRP